MQGQMSDGCKLAGHQVRCRGASDHAGEDQMLDGYRWMLDRYRWTGQDAGVMLVGGGVRGGRLCRGVGDSVRGDWSCTV